MSVRLFSLLAVATAAFAGSTVNPFPTAELIAAPIPEPSTWLMGIAGVGIVAAARRFRNK